LGYILAAYPEQYALVTDLPINVQVTGFTFNANSLAGSGARNAGIAFIKVAGPGAGLFNCVVNTFNDPEASGIWVMDGSALTLDGNAFNNNIEYGIYVLGKYPFREPILIPLGQPNTAPIGSMAEPTHNLSNETLRTDYQIS
jgi:hypothetical protein